MVMVKVVGEGRPGSPVKDSSGERGEMWLDSDLFRWKSHQDLLMR